MLKKAYEQKKTNSFLLVQEQHKKDYYTSVCPVFIDNQLFPQTRQQIRIFSH